MKYQLLLSFIVDGMGYINTYTSMSYNSTNLAFCIVFSVAGAHFTQKRTNTTYQHFDF